MRTFLSPSPHTHFRNDFFAPQSYALYTRKRLAGSKEFDMLRRLESPSVLAGLAPWSIILAAYALSLLMFWLYGP